MKKLAIVGLLVLTSVLMYSQNGPPPPNENGHGNGNGHPGWENGKGNPHGASVGDGIYILILLGVGYAGYKIRSAYFTKEVTDSVK